MLRVILPLVAAKATLRTCDPHALARGPKANAVRELMWPVLLVAIGMAWFVTKTVMDERATFVPKLDLLFGALTVVVCRWLWLQLCTDDEDQADAWLLVLAVIAAFITYNVARRSPLAALILLPVLIWLLFAERLRVPKLYIRLPRIEFRAPEISLVSPGSVRVVD